LPEEAELVWEDGSAYPSYCIDTYPAISTAEASAMVAAGFGIFGLVGFAASRSAKTTPPPFAPREYPYDNLREELGKEE
jgi:hypothetical protein